MAGFALGKLRTVRKNDDMCRIYFNKNCESGNLINEKLLPDDICASNQKKVFTTCIDKLISANYDPTKFVKILINRFGDSATKKISNRKQLNELTKTMCAELKACPNFISEKAISKCPHCDSDDSDADDNGDQDGFVVASVWNF